MSDLSALGETVQSGDPDRFRTALFAPPEPRERLFALYAFNLEIAKIAPMVSEAMLGEIRLQWWRETLDQIYGGGPVRKHEVATPLAVAVKSGELPRAQFDALIDARGNDLDPDFPASASALTLYIEETAGGLTCLAARSLAPDLRPDGEAAVHDVGFAIGAARYLMAVPKLVAAGRRPLPMEWVDGLAADGRERLKRGRAARQSVPKAAAPALLEAVTAAHNLSAAAERSETRNRWAVLWAGLRGRW